MVLKNLFDPYAVLFRQHLQRLENVQPKVMCEPPKAINPHNLCKLGVARNTMTRYFEIDRGNRKLVKGFTNFLRCGGIVQDEIEKKFQNKFMFKSGIEHMCLMAKHVEKENHIIANRILNAKTKLDTGIRKVSNTKDRSKQSEERFQIPYAILNKYKGFNFAQEIDKKTLHSLMRPKVYFDLALQTAGRMLGRVVMQLYTEACPQVVLEFVRIFKNGNIAEMKVLRLFPSLWLEAELSLSASTWLQKPRIEYDMRAIDHGQSAGVLSFAKNNLSGFCYGVLNFSISFRPLAVLNGRRVGFGKVIQGQKILDWVQIFGTKNGKPTKEIKITNCGLLL